MKELTKAWCLIMYLAQARDCAFCSSSSMLIGTTKDIIFLMELFFSSIIDLLQRSDGGN
jgi:hypothetical protein